MDLCVGLCLLMAQGSTKCMIIYCSAVFFFFKQKTAYELRISDWSSDVCSSDLFDVLRFLLHADIGDGVEHALTHNVLRRGTGVARLVREAAGDSRGQIHVAAEGGAAVGIAAVRGDVLVVDTDAQVMVAGVVLDVQTPPDRTRGVQGKGGQDV